MGRFSVLGPRSGQHWFRIGTFEVTTTTLITALAVIALIVDAVSASLLAPLNLETQRVAAGQVWRLVTWPLVNSLASPTGGILLVLALAVFWWLGEQLERSLGSRRYLRFILVLIIVPALAMTAFSLIPGQAFAQPDAGIYDLETAVLVAFAAAYPMARFFFGIPFWVVTVALVGIDLLELAAVRDGGYLVFVALTIVVALLATRSFGLCRHAWIPEIPLPHLITGDPARQRERAAARETRKRRRAAQLRVVHDADIDALLDKISEHGIHSLSPDERRRLDEHRHSLGR